MEEKGEPTPGKISRGTASRIIASYGFAGFMLWLSACTGFDTGELTADKYEGLSEAEIEDRMTAEVKATVDAREADERLRKEVKDKLPYKAYTNSVFLDTGGSEGGGIIFYQGYSEKRERFVFLIIAETHIFLGEGYEAMGSLEVSQPQLVYDTAYNIGKGHYENEEFRYF